MSEPLARVVSIVSKDDPAIAPFTAVRERDLVGRDGLFIAEGEVVVRVFVGVTSRMRPPRSLLLAQNRVESMRDVIDALPVGVPVYVAPQDVMDQIVGFPIHRGILALGDRGAPIAPSYLATRGKLFVGLVGLTNHDNVGSIFRNAAAFGADGVLLDAETCDPLYRKAIRVSAGTSLVVPFARTKDANELLDVLAEANIEAIALSPRGDETIDDLSSSSASQQQQARARALLLGTEGPGLPDHVLARTRRIRINMRSDVDSLNVAVASGIALHALKSLKRS